MNEVIARAADDRHIAAVILDGVFVVVGKNDRRAALVIEELIAARQHIIASVIDERQIAVGINCKKSPAFIRRRTLILEREDIVVARLQINVQAAAQGVSAQTCILETEVVHVLNVARVVVIILVGAAVISVKLIGGSQRREVGDDDVGARQILDRGAVEIAAELDGIIARARRNRRASAAVDNAIIAAAADQRRVDPFVLDVIGIGAAVDHIV